MNPSDLNDFRLLGKPTSEYSFAEFNTADDDVAEEERWEEMKQEVAETLAKAAARTNESLPSFLWTPIINPYDDGFLYIKRGIDTINEVISAVINRPNKFKDYYEYIDALADWNEYKAFVENEFGSWKAFVEASKQGLTTLPVKIEPQLKKIEGNRALRKVKVALSRFIPEDHASPDEIRAAIENFEEPIELYDDWFEYEFHIKKLNDAAAKRNAVRERVRNMYRVTYASMDPRMDAITQFLRGDTEPDYRGIQRPKSLVDEAIAFHDHDFDDPAIVERDLQAIGRSSAAVYIDSTEGIWRKQEDAEASEFWSALNAAGYDAFDIIASSGMSKQAKKAAIGTLSMDSGEYSEKQLKKMKKRRKKTEKAMADRLMQDEQVRRTLTHNRINLDRDDELLSFTMDDILRGDP